jgi:plasmid stabilization system protein ParE
MAEVQRTLQRLIENPRVGPRVSPRAHKLRLRDFQYNVVYRIEESSVVVQAFSHERRDPEHWRRRI